VNRKSEVDFDKRYECNDIVDGYLNFFDVLEESCAINAEVLGKKKS
jgi:hypothetical protein